MGGCDLFGFGFTTINEKQNALFIWSYGVIV